MPTVRSFWAILWDQFDEFYMQVLLILGTASLVISLFQDVKYKWLESISIYFAVLFAGMIQTLCDWGKEKQFLRLRQEIMNEKISVLRGSYGTSQTIYVKDLVVGDVILLNQGDRVPADCLLIEEMDMKVDQKQFYPDAMNSEMTEKQCSYNDVEMDIGNNPDPILLQDSIVMTGTGKAIVLAVGEHTMKEREIRENLKDNKYALQIENRPTPFQKKLETLAGIIGTYAKTICIVSLILFGLVWLLFVMCSDYKLVDGASIQRAIDLAATAAALLAVCIPEGMPLVISMAMAFSVDKLKDDHLLIKNLDALETAGQVIDILTGKTATLTTGDMEVCRINTQGQTFNASNLEANIEVVKTLQQAIVFNNDASMQMEHDRYKAKGSPVDVGLLQFVAAEGVPIQDKLVERENQHDLKLWIPFSSDRKCMTVAYALDKGGVTRVIVKGAPEIVVPMCTGQLDSYAQPQGFDGAGSQGEHYLNETVTKDIILGDSPANAENRSSVTSPTGLKALTFGYVDIATEEFESLKSQHRNFEDEDTRRVIESNLTMIATVGLSDPLREGIQDSIHSLREGGTNVRLFSGDHKMAVMTTAVQIDLAEYLEETDFCMSGADVLAALKPLMMEVEDEDEGRGKSFDFKNTECMKRFKKDIKKTVMIVYRASPELKHMFTCALRRVKATVAVTGEGLSDSRALSEANVGFTMGEDGCAAAKDHADIILMDDNFMTVITAIKWGRNIQDNVRKFVQYQITVNITCMIYVISTTIFLGHSPFNVVQLLWINLIMDVLAAIAFATENPDTKALQTTRISSKDKIITKAMTRQIMFQFIYQLICMLVLTYFGPKICDIEYNFYSTEMKNADGTPSYRMLHQTFLFQVFIMMNLFNMINCRVLDAMPVRAEIEESSIEEASMKNKPNFNIFTRPFNNFWFWIIFFGELNVQMIMVGYAWLGVFFTTTPLTFGMHMTAVGLGIGSWAVCALTKLTGDKTINAMPEFGEDEKALQAAQERTSRASSMIAMTPADADNKTIDDDE